MKTTIGYALCGSFCTLARSLDTLCGIADDFDILPIVSENVKGTDTRFGSAEHFISRLEAISGKHAIASIRDAEPIGPKGLCDIMVISPCTGNTLAKLANGITDTTVTMAAKSHLRCQKPLVIALCTNDALSANLKNIAAMLSRKNVYFLPMIQDDPIGKPHSLVADLERLRDAIEAARLGKQIFPIFE